MKVFAYLRVSTEEQLKKGGLARQSEAINAFCGSKDWTIVRVFTDQQSGGDEFADRAALHEILELAGSGSALNVQIIVVERADRLARDLMVQEIFLRECRKRNIKVYAADSGEELVLDGADPTRVLIRQILGALAQWEKSQISLKLQAGRRKKKRETGKPCGGPVPYGEAKDSLRRQAEQAAIALILDANRKGKTMMAIAQSLSKAGFPSPSGGSWWSPGTIWNIIKRGKTVA